MKHRYSLVGTVLFMLTAGSAWAGTTEITVHPRRQTLKQDAAGHNHWEVVTRAVTLPPQETAIIICDMWDRHWSRGATSRVADMAPRMNAVIRAARARGVTIVHAPSDTMDFYENSPARKRVLAAAASEPPANQPHDDPPLPIDDSDGGSDTGEKEMHKAWTRQHPAIEIDEATDGVSDNGREIWNFLQQRHIRHVLIMGVHTNMCVLNRTFAIKQMVRWGVDVMLVRDLTDTMYNPAMRPYVNHDEGTRLVVDYIEKFWCPTIESRDLLGVSTAATTRPATQPQK